MQRIISSSTSRSPAARQEPVFAELHNLAKHITHLGEALESSLLLVEGIVSRLRMEAPPDAHLSAPANSNPVSEAMISQRLLSALLYRQTLFRSTKLRLGSLNARVTNSITLAFNVLTASDSMILIRYSNLMKIIAAVTMIFLPTTAVAAVLGSQLFNAERDAATGAWTVLATPLFPVLWYITIPATVALLVSAMLWHRYTHRQVKLRS